ncbi:MAG: CHASE2 domain-containing protein, partial [Candidatus Aminicenantes bacterium]|nr:CHASE2 domain-containing protein [Candidatus Aminicenantes bacterium]
MRKKVGRGTLVGLAAAVLVLALRAVGLFTPLEWKSWDARLRLLARPADASRDIVLVFIDQASLDFYEKEQGVSWPWPRQLYSAIADFLRTGGAKAVFFDLILSETSSYGVEDDADFARAMARAGNVILPVFLSKTDAMERGGEAARSLERFSLKDERFPENALRALRSVTLPVPAFLEAARAVGNVQFTMDGDAIYRRLPLVFSFEGLVLPSLPAAVVRFVRGRTGITGAPLDADGNLILKYHGPTGTYKGYSIAGLINSWAQLESGQAPQVPPNEFAGKIVVVGASAPGLLDQRASPFGGNYAGMEILA